MNTNTMKLNMEQLEQVSGSIYSSESQPSFVYFCSHPNKVKTCIEYEDNVFFFWSQHLCAYLCPDCHNLIWVHEDP